MAQKVTVLLVDDLDGTSADDVSTVRFGLDGVDYEIDLTSDNARRLRDAMAAHVANGRKIGKAGKPLVRVAAGGSGRDKAQLQAIRDWAKANEFSVSDRGRIPGWIIEEFDKAH